MRNLKRVLSLALACVMVIGMMVMTTGAAQIADFDEISNQEAVVVMNALGILEGDDNGVFNPTGILTREQAAKIICFMLMGPDKAKMLTGTSNFTDVAADRWSAPYISYCNSLGIISGYAGEFNPTGELTGVAFAKMLLVALGYDANAEGYVNNDNWSTNIGSDAIEAGLSIKGVNLDAALTRENAAQMAFQTLTATMVYYEGGMNITTPDGTTINAGAECKTKSEAGYTDYQGADVNDTLQFCEKHFPDLKCTITAAAADVVANDAWTLNGAPVVTAYEAPTFTFTADLTAGANKTVENTLKGYTFTSTNAIEDGTTGGAAASIANVKALTGNGVEVNVYTNGKNIHAVTVTNTGLVEITAVNAATGDISLTKRAGATWTGLDTTIEKDETDPIYNALAAIGKDGFALVTVEYDGVSAYNVVSVAEPKVATGYVTYIDGNDTTNTAVSIDGTSYKLAGVADTSVTAADTLAVNAVTERNLYLDPYGYALYNKNTTTPIVTMPDTIYVAKKYTADDKWGTPVNMAQGVLNDGTVVYVQTDIAATDGTLYTYVKNNQTGVYALTDTNVPDTTTVGIDAVTTAVTAPGLLPTTKSADGWYFASDVQFMYINNSGDQLKVEIKDGMQVGQTLTTNDWYVIAKDVNNNYVIKTVIIEGAAPAEAAEDLIFVKTAWTATNYVSTKLNSKNATLYGYEAYVNGVKTTIWVTTAGTKAQGVYEYTIDAANEATTMGSAASNYVGTAEALTGITVIGEKAYWDVATATYDDYDISGATVYDTTNNGLTSAAALKAALTAGKTITVAYSYNTQTQTIPVIYVVSCT